MGCFLCFYLNQSKDIDFWKKVFCTPVQALHLNVWHSLWFLLIAPPAAKHQVTQVYTCGLLAISCALFPQKIIFLNLVCILKKLFFKFCYLC